MVTNVETIKFAIPEGTVDAFGLINGCINDLRAVKIRAEDLSTSGTVIVDVINRLYSLIDGLKKEKGGETYGGTENWEADYPQSYHHN